jgi:hypothetical protein
MLVPSDFLAYATRKQIDKAPSRSLIEAAFAPAPGGGRKKSTPVEPNEPRDGRVRDEEVDYLNARASTVDVVL